MNKNAFTNHQLGLFGEALPETNPIVVLGETTAAVLEVLASLFLQILEAERQPKKSELNHVRCH
ncbi:MAG: hypothetical protein ACRENG_06425 [bacterium]